jgi:hypothetical protein
MGMKHLISLMWNSIPLIENVARGCEVMNFFLESLKAFDSCQVLNMLALMLNPHFKSL